MRILHVIPHYYPAVRYGGPIQSVHGLAAATAALGHVVHVYTTNIDGPGVSDVPTGEPVLRDGVSISYFPAGLGRRVFRSPAMVRALQQNISGFDVVHIHYVWVWSTVAAASAARLYNVPYILAPRGMLVADLINRRSRFAKRAWLAMFDRHTIAHAKFIHATSQIEADELRALGLVSPAIKVIPNGITVPAELNQMRERGKFRLEGVGHSYILFLGRISWKKGLDRLISAMAILPGVHLVVAGYDEKGFRGTIERQAREMAVSDRTHFVGPVEGSTKWSLIQGANCLVLPSYNENFGMSVVEAMAVGCPVVVTAEVGLSQIVAETGCGVVAQGDTAALAIAIKLVMADSDRARQMGEAGRRAVHERFGWRSISEKMLETYGACLPGGAKSEFI